MTSSKPLSFPSRGWIRAMDVSIESAEPEEVVLSCPLGEQHMQPFGLVHGGVHAGLIESACSIGAILCAPAEHDVVGVENHTSFVRPVKSGTLRTVARPIQVGKQAQLWEAQVTDDQGRLVATGRLRLFNVERR